MAGGNRWLGGLAGGVLFGLLPIAAPAFAEGRLPADRAGLVVRVQRLEEEVARLRGRVEELEYALRRLEARLAGSGTIARPAGVPAEDAPEASDAGTSPLLNPPRPGEALPAERVAQAPTELAREGTGEPPAPIATPPTVAAPPAVEATGPGEAASEVGTRGPVMDPREAFTGPPEARYRLGLDLLEQGRFDEAARVFRAFLEDQPDHPRAPDAAFWLAETHFFRQDYATAAQLYARNFRTYGPDAPRAPETLLKLGMALAAIGERERACRTFAELEKRYPRAPAHIRQALARERTVARCP